MTATIEKIVSILEEMPEEQVDQVYQLTLSTYAQNPSRKQVTKADVLRNLEISRKQYSEGKYMRADVAANSMREKYGL
ncbi:MAG: hypothetical protein VZQ80_06185 [Lachnospiraceae bacterium]|nr:hypothetical protein [Lachnospiraceae bacterium]